MAEDQEKKPKATLIKHRKPEETDKGGEEKEKDKEKKKVVVVKKKVVVRKKSPKVVAKKEEESPKETAEKPVRPAPSAGTETERPGKPAEKTLPQTKTGQTKRAETGEKRYERREPPRKDTRPKPDKERKKDFRPEQKRTGPPPKPSEQKPPAKKFKTKKRGGYQKPKREEHQEKILPIKKKRTQRANPVPKEVDIMEVITVSDLAKKMNLKASDLIGKLMSMGVMATINQQIDADTAEILAGEYGCKVNIVSLYDETIIESEEDSQENLEPRPPIITVMGHVDHGKTKLLDAIRSANVVDGEFGGITQHIGAYALEHPKGKLVFLDTPGHEAFTLMRARGAQVTDIVILVVAANDGVMPQTKEAISHAKEAGVPIIVAINKVDLADANPDRVKQQLSDYDLIPEDWGGSTLFNEISALNGQGIDALLDSIMLQAEILELKANYDRRAEGKVIESKIDHGRGIVSTVLILNGTLRVGDTFIAGIYPGKVRAMFDDKGQKIDEAPPSTPVEILGFTGLAKAGDPFQVTESEKVARQVGSKRQELKKVEEAENVKKITLDNLYDSIQEGDIQELKVIIKGDVHGSVEALQSALEKLSTPEIRLGVIQGSAGAINESDIMLAAASNAVIIGFHVRPTGNAAQLAEKEKVEIRRYNIIYDAINDIKSAMEGMLAPDIKEEIIGTAEVRDTFKVPKIGLIAGCFVTSGKVRRNANIRVFREGIQVYSGKISSLKRFKEDAREVEQNYECGIGIENFNDVKVGDEFEIFETKEVAKKLGS
jgi:translation initiation factor IF-2